ncbi:MAG: T9SS type A sorting domain-containing protein [Bacteroidota bacterium]
MKVRTTVPVEMGRALWLLLITVFLSVSLSAQEALWPGDINDNGIVNNVDLLYWGVAEKEKGPKRNEHGTDWHAYGTAVDWTDDYLIGLNYSQGDADGKGKIDKKDRDALLEDNYGLTHGTLTPDAFLVGDPSTDPLLLIEAENPTVYPGDEITFDISLGDADHPVEHYFGIAFTISFDPTYIAPETRDPWKPSVAEIDLLNNTWLNGGGSSKSYEYMYLLEEEGELDVVLLRKKLGENDGHGQIASFTIIMEDIVFLEDQGTTVTIDDIKLIDQYMVEYPVAGSTEHFTILANTSALASNNTGLVPAAGNLSVADDLSTENPTPEVESPKVPVLETETPSLQLKLFPNPSAEWIQLTQPEATASLELISIYNASGVLVLQQEATQRSTQLIDIARLAAGNYYLHLHTASGKSVVQFHKAAH